MAKTCNPIEEDLVLRCLSDGKWKKADQIWRETGVSPRAIRHIAEKTHRLIGGEKGYKRVDKASRGEIKNAYNGLMSRIQKLKTRAYELYYGKQKSLFQG